MGAGHFVCSVGLVLERILDVLASLLHIRAGLIGLALSDLRIVVGGFAECVPGAEVFNSVLHPLIAAIFTRQRCALRRPPMSRPDPRVEQTRRHCGEGQ